MNDLRVFEFDRTQRRELERAIGVDVPRLENYQWEILKLIDSADQNISNLKPSEWCEQNRMMTADVTGIPGLFSYDNSPYTREIVDCLSPDHPAHTIAVMKGAQIGFSTGVIEAGIGWIISNNPGNILFLVGHDDLLKDSMSKIDRMIDNSGIRHLIRSTSKRARNTKSGDTDLMKEYPDGYLKLGIANHKYLRNISMRYGFIDDFESMKQSSKESGSTRKMIEMRFASFADKRKIFYISTPENAETSNIEPAYELGDKRKYHLTCPHCDEYIALEWSVPSRLNPNNTAGITWKLDDYGELITSSVGYTCQECEGFFDDSNKMEMLRAGKWIPTAKPSAPGYYSYHISALYAPVTMYGWAHYVEEWLTKVHPGGERDEAEYKAFITTVLGLTYKDAATTISATKLQKNIRPYDICKIPDTLSRRDGNGRIIMLTCGTDLNGTEDDARIDFEIVAHSEAGPTYSIRHGSIGTFINKDKNPHLREKMTYKFGQPNSVWPVLKEVLSARYERESDGSAMRIFMTALDTGHEKDYAFKFIETHQEQLGGLIVGVKGGQDQDKPVFEDRDRKTFRPSQTRNNLFLVETNLTKDNLAKQMNHTWDPDTSEVQPPGFMNFPTPSEGLYLFRNYFQHYEAEHKIAKDGKFVWVKQQSHLQNHMWDCRLYSIVARDILLDKIFKEFGVKNGTWADFVNLIPSE